MGLELQNIPEIVWTYFGHHEFMKKHTGMYGLDEMRTKYHDELCRTLGIRKEESKLVTDHLYKYETAYDMYIALMKLKK